MSSFFGSKKKKNKEYKESEGVASDKMTSNNTTTGTNSSNENGTATHPGGPPDGSQNRNKPKLVFHCQQAHGSPTGLISGFTNVKELYKKIADCYDFPVDQILFCTLNTHKVDMSRLLGGQIGLEDFLFAHIKGRPKEVEVHKAEDALGLTITDNGAGYAFIKRIKEGSIMDKIEGINVGDHIEKINGQSLIGSRHFEVAKMLKEIPKDSKFLFRVVEPMKSGFSHIQSNNYRKSGSIGSGKATLRLHAGKPATIETPDDILDVAIEKINVLLESFLGISDNDLAQRIWEMSQKFSNPSEFALALDESDLGEFGFTDTFIFDLWAFIGDAKSGRLKNSKDNVTEIPGSF